MEWHTESTVSRRRMLHASAMLSGGALVGSATVEAPGRNVDALACGDSIRGELTDADRTGFRSDEHFQDAYEFEGGADEFVRISMTAIGDPSGSDNPQERTDETDHGERMAEPPGDPYLYLLDRDGAIVAEDDDSGGAFNAHVVVPRLPMDGEYVIVATSWGAGETFAYELSIECGDPFDREPIGCGDSITEELTTDDSTGFLSEFHAHDAYSFDGTAGELVEIGMTGLEAPIDDDCTETIADPLLVLLGPDLAFVASDDDGGDRLDALLTARLPTDGEYTIVATSWTPELYFAYDLSVDCREPLDPEPIGCDETVEGELTPEDERGIRTEFGRHVHDAYAFEGTAGESVRVTMRADRFATDDDRPPGDPYLFLFDPDGRLVAEDDDGGGDFGSVIQQVLYADGEYTVVATSFDAQDFFPYELTLACAERPSLAAPTPIECGDPVAGALEPTDPTGVPSPQHFHDHYAFEAAAGDVVTVSMSAADGDSLLLVLDPDGEVVAWDDDGGGDFDALVGALALETDGPYSIVATSFSPAATFEYDLTLQCR